MTAALSPDGSTVAARRIDQLCDAFESDWRAGRQAVIEEYLAAAEDVDRSLLLPELIALEAGLRRAAGESAPPVGGRARRVGAHRRHSARSGGRG